MHQPFLPIDQKMLADPELPEVSGVGEVVCANYYNK